MAKCKRCGAIFDYDKKDGVCPKCCYYNRPPGTPERDTEWISTYNVEENTYQLPKSIIEQEEEEHRGLFRRKSHADRRRYTSEKDCRMEGSHVHTEKRGSASAARGGAKSIPSESAGKNKKMVGIILFLILLVSALSIIAPFIFEKVLRSVEGGNGGPEMINVESWEVRQIPAEDFSEGVQIGELTYSGGEGGAEEFMKTGEIPEIPKGEKCIVIHLKADESSLDYHGTDWARPYVYDGQNYHELVNGLVMKSHNLPKIRDNEFMYRYLSKYENKDFDGLAAFFVDENAESVTLCIPDQRVEDGSAALKGVVEIELPVKPGQQEGGVTDGQ